MKGMGDFLNHASQGVRDGFDYNGGGYSVGTDKRIMPHAILGLGFGDLYGKMRGRSFAGDIDQQTRIGMLYGGWYRNLNKNNAVRVNVNSSLQLNARWRTYAGYEFEGRNKATAHRFNAGVSYAY
jgi:uncharacterized protein with beta-barrel porin domain